MGKVVNHFRLGHVSFSNYIIEAFFYSNGINCWGENVHKLVSGFTLRIMVLLRVSESIVVFTMVCMRIFS